MSNFSEVLHLDGASIIFDNRTVLKDMHIVMNAGEFCYVKGDTGSGKSTLIKALYGLLPMNGTRLYVAGQDLSDLSKDSLPLYRRSLGLIADFYDLFLDKTVFNNLDAVLSAIDWPVASERERRINEVLDQMNLHMLLGERVADLPSGLKQKVKVARSVLNKPKLILADNPMAYLDTKSADNVMDVFIDLVKEHQSSVLCMVPDETLVDRYPARSYFCGDGTLTESR